MRLRRTITLHRLGTCCAHCGGSGFQLDVSALGADLREARKAAGFGLRELATKIEVSPTHVSDIENGKRAPSSALLERFAWALGVQIRWRKRKREVGAV